MPPGTTVSLPDGVCPPFEVYLNGVRQQEGSDYRLRGNEVVFAERLVKEGRLGAWRWFLGAWGIGTYRRNDVVDIRYRAGGRPAVAHDVPFEGAGRDRGTGT